MDKAYHINEYLKAGFILMPLIGKRPVMKYWNKLEFRMLLMEADFPNNIGVKLTDTMLVIDYDPRNDTTENQSALTNLLNDIGTPHLDTFIVQSGGHPDGVHIYLLKPANIRVHTTINNDRYSGIEFKTAGAQMVVPPSIHPDTDKVYQIKYGSASKLEQAPEALITLIKRTTLPMTTDVPVNSKDVYYSDQTTCSNYIQYLLTAPPAIEGQHGNAQTYKVACRGKDLGLYPQKTIELMLLYWNTKCEPAWDLEGLTKIVNHAYKYAVKAAGNDNILSFFNTFEQKQSQPQAQPQSQSQPQRQDTDLSWFLTPTGKNKNCLHNVCNYMQVSNSPVYNKLQYNVFTEDIEFKQLPMWRSTFSMQKTWTDEDAIHFKHWLSSNGALETSTGLIHEAAIAVSHMTPVHPVSDYLTSLKWDGVQRIQNWLTIYAGASETPYTNAVGRMTLIAAVTRVFKPGAKYDYMLILEGKQGIGKSTLVALLGKEWFGDIVIDPHNKDTIDALRGKWIVEVSEMTECTRYEANAIKRFLTCTSDRVRLAYAKNAKDFPRRCIFIGTINPTAGKGYLKDPTGNRRFLPVALNRVNIPKLQTDVNQLWAEAYHEYKTTEQAIYLTDRTVEKMALTEADKRRVVDSWFEVVSIYVENKQNTAVSVQDIISECLQIPISRVTNAHQDRVANIMHILQWESTSTPRGIKFTKKY
jgi:predicted P-loop ATPase